MCGGREAGENALLGQEKSTSADGEDGSLAGRVPLLELGEVGDEAEGLELLVEDLLGVAADDDEEVKVLEAVMGVLVGNLGANDDTLSGDDLGLGADDGNLKGLGVC